VTRQLGLSRYDGIPDLPPLVSKAIEATRRMGYDKACLPEAGRLLYSLAAIRQGMTIGETGTACGVGAAWLASGMSKSSRLYTVELDRTRADASRRLFDGLPNVAAVHGDWRSIAGFAPFDLLFVDGGLDKTDSETTLSLLAPRGLAVFDDLTPRHAWSAAQRAEFAAGDPIRKAWAAEARATSFEVLLTEDESALLIFNQRR
jgi:predicted O-methyltransferase YrrM